jgi:hypothetical protein
MMFFQEEDWNKNKPMPIGISGNLQTGSVSGGRHQHRINHVNHAVTAVNICLGNVNAAIELDAILGADLYICAVDCLGHFSAHFHHIGGHDLAAHHVVRKDGFELGNVLKQGIHSTRWQFGKGLVGGGKHSERSGAFQCVHQASSGYSGGEGFEVTGCNSRVNDVMRMNCPWLNGGLEEISSIAQMSALKAAIS